MSSSPTATCIQNVFQLLDGKVAATSSVQFSAAVHLTPRLSVHCENLLLEMLNYQWKPEGHLPALQ